MASRGQKPTNAVASKNPTMRYDELAQNDFYDRRDGVSGNIIYVACPHEFRVGLLEARADMLVYGDFKADGISCDEITATTYNGLPTDKEGVKTVNDVSPDKEGNVALDTDHVPEGDDKYFTESRARESFSVTSEQSGPGSAVLSYSEAEGDFTFTYTGPAADVPDGSGTDDSLYWSGTDWVSTSTTAAKILLGLGTAADADSSDFCQVSNNLSDVTASTARSNLGLGSCSTLNTGTDDGDVCEFDGVGYPAADGSQITGVPGTSTNVTLTGTPDYITIDVATQVITRGSVDLANDCTGTTPTANGGTGETSLPMISLITAADARDARTEMGLGDLATERRCGLNIGGGGGYRDSYPPRTVARD